MASASITARTDDLIVGCIEFLGNDHILRLRETDTSNSHRNFDVLLMECNVVTEPDKLRSE